MRLGMKTFISFAALRNDISGLAELTREYLEWDRKEFERVSGISLDIEPYLKNTLSNVDAYMPPTGRIVMVRDSEGVLVGFVILKKLAEDAAEIKRFYVTPKARGTGLGSRLIAEAIKTARRMKYKSVFLESGTYMPAAHRLYKSLGFEETEPYPGNEHDASFLPYLIFMLLTF